LLLENLPGAVWERSFVKILCAEQLMKQRSDEAAGIALCRVEARTRRSWWKASWREETSSWVHRRDMPCWHAIQFPPVARLFQQLEAN